MTGKDSEKGQRYIAVLDNARCQNKWEEVPELIRKVTKHAPQKTVFLQIASAESQIAAYSQKRPSTAQSSFSSSSTLTELIPSLLSTIENEDGTPEELFQTQVCLGWLHWSLNEPGLAAAHLPKDFGKVANKLGEHISPWTEVCLVKGCYIKGAAQATLSTPHDGLVILNTLTPWLSSHSASLSSKCSQFLYWSEKVLGKAASIASDEASKGVPLVDDEVIKTALKLCRLWSAHPYVSQQSSSQALHAEGPDELATQASIWKSYYDLLTAILQHGLLYVPQSSGPDRPQLASEFRRVEGIYETQLMRELKFPTANSSNSEVESWVEQVIRNWQILCGPSWSDEELGEGGQNALGRSVLDILYRAAAKTYHSHLILRRLFHVHSALTDFDLAVKALDSYVEIVVGAKERAEKAAQYGELESDEHLIQTLAEGVTMLVCFGSEDEARKANDLVTLLKRFVDKHVQFEGDEEEGRILVIPDQNNSQVVSPRVIATAYKAIGTGLANWASWTPISEDRDDLRAEAIESLERSIAPELGDEFNYSSLYTLALLLAENRDLDGAIDYVKVALSSNSHTQNAQSDLTRERDLVPLWHLLALLLSAKRDYDIAERSCEAAFEQFPSPVTSLANGGQQQGSRDMLNAIEFRHALINQLRAREKERIIETRMTQLAFIELQEGAEAAVNHSDQLLSLFATLFQDIDFQPNENKDRKPEHLVPPKSSAGTVKSLRGSIFGRNKASRATDRRVEAVNDNKPVSTSSSIHHDHVLSTDFAPAIQVTDEHNGIAENPETLGRSDSTRHKLRKRSGTLKKPEDQRSTYMNGSEDPVNGIGMGTNGSRTPQQSGSGEDLPPGAAGLAVSRTADQPQSAKQPLRPVAHNMDQKEIPPPAGHSRQPPEQDVRLPYRFDSPTRAITKFPPVQAQKNALAILVKVWLLIAGLYRRASLFEDAHEACEEAAKHVDRVEALVAAQESSARAFRTRGWAAAKSSEELWADLHTEQGLLALAQSRPHEALELFEEALVRDLDHPKATVYLANLLLDIWDKKMTVDPPDADDLRAEMSALHLPGEPPQKSKPSTTQDQNKDANAAGTTQPDVQASATGPKEDEPKLLNRIAARDRAYMLLSALTKRGTAWDSSEAWYALSRAHEASGEIEKLKDVLWWCIELEDRRPIRHWSNIGSGRYVL
ncbi:putative filamentation protein (Rhf1) [Aspergillus clavatus NRRL 1]|uniref:Filamentation protein (Rhf1), putative n=1 Tax=Aspergillus clavatus (strain ATCC 1007 / CBS 513.65 / DSM 816 / NCTC 3887 / NRRL 1 / QM 1276 / 107) TaxID=344612 RepID=A1C9Z7_ASPCL|nr:filamentation protein (Rhf1), putative [Aspergillus clavatus NRRL 1]EAW12565.1 filamentation protein (Rhf1), putative [Aspergillus clavatus NRRL 1]